MNNRVDIELRSIDVIDEISTSDFSLRGVHRTVLVGHSKQERSTSRPALGREVTEKNLVK